MGLTDEELFERCRQLDIDCDVAVNAAESAKKDLEDIAKKTWQNIITILNKDLKKDQTPDQALAELIATSRLSKEALQDIRTGTAGLDVVGKIEYWFGTIVGGASTSSLVGYVGIGIYARYAQSGLAAAEAATIAANDKLLAFQLRTRYIGRVLGPNVAAQGAQEEIMLTNNAIAAARQEAVMMGRVAAASKWSARLGNFGLWAGVAALGVMAAAEIYKIVVEHNATERIKHSLHEIYTSRFYMIMQQKYLEFFVRHVSQVESYTALLVEGDVNGAATVLQSMTSHTIEIDPETKKVKPESIKPDPWSEEAVTAFLSTHDSDKNQNTAEDPTREERLKIHEEQLNRIQEMMKKDLEDAKADAAAAKPN